MRTSELSTEIQVRTGISKLVQGLMVASVISNLLFAGYIVFKKDHSRITITPSQIRKSFWIEDEKIDPSYAEQMTNHVLDCAFNRTPANAALKRDCFMHMVAPRAFPDLDTKLKIAEKNIKDENASQFFDATGMRIKPDGTEVFVSGSLDTFISDRRTSKDRKGVLIKYQWDGAKLSIARFIDNLPADMREPFNEAELEKTLADLNRLPGAAGVKR